MVPRSTPAPLLTRVRRSSFTLSGAVVGRCHHEMTTVVLVLIKCVNFTIFIYILFKCCDGSKVRLYAPVVKGVPISGSIMDERN